MDDKITLQRSAEQALNNFVRDKKGNTVILVFTAKWSGSAQILAIFLQELSQEFSNVTTHYMDAEQYESMAAEMNVGTLPTTFILRNERTLDRFSGLLSKKKIREKLLAVQAQEKLRK